MKLYIDIDGVLLNYDTDSRAEYSVELIDYITNEFDCYWLTTHCKGDAEPALEYLSKYFPDETIQKLQKIKPTYWEDMKTEGIDFDSSFMMSANQTSIRIPSSIARMSKVIGRRYQDMRWTSSLPLGYGEKSVIMLLTLGLKLTKDEMLAIRWHMTAWELAFQSPEQKSNLQKAREIAPLCVLIQAADGLSTSLLEA